MPFIEKIAYGLVVRGTFDASDASYFAIPWSKYSVVVSGGVWSVNGTVVALGETQTGSGNTHYANLPLFTNPAQTPIPAIVMKHSAAFTAGSGIGTIVLDLVIAEEDGAVCFVGTTDVSQAPADNLYDTGPFDMWGFAAHPIALSIKGNDGDPATITSGAVDIWIPVSAPLP